MRTLVAAILFLAVGAATPATAAPPAKGTPNGKTAAPPAIPDTPAGRVFRAWFDAFNSGERAQIAAYLKRYEPTESPDGLLGFSRHVGGFDVVAVHDSRPLDLVVQLKERNSPTNALAGVHLKTADPPTLVSFDLNAMPPGKTAAEMAVTVDGALRARIIDNIAAKLTEYYIYPDVAKKMVDAVRGHQKSGDYDAITDGFSFASLLTRDLKAVSHDGHLRVQCDPEVLPKEDPPDDAPPPPGFLDFLKRQNCAFEKVERLEQNIGYIKFNAFGDRKLCGPIATAAFSFVPHVDALILDLRDNHGGSPEMVSFVASYLFDKRTHINDLYYRHDNKTTEYWTDPSVPGSKFLGKPVYVLTSHGTFSGGEEFTLDLKSQKRATIVGETTGGGAHPTGAYRVEDHFSIGVPGGRPINPITKGDWEGTGVAPDVKTSADEAFDVARKLALEAIAKSRPQGPPKKK
jgi:peptidase S41-like protein